MFLVAPAQVIEGVEERSFVSSPHPAGATAWVLSPRQSASGAEGTGRLASPTSAKPIAAYPKSGRR